MSVGEKKGGSAISLVSVPPVRDEPAWFKSLVITLAQLQLEDRKSKRWPQSDDSKHSSLMKSVCVSRPQQRKDVHCSAVCVCVFMYLRSALPTVSSLKKKKKKTVVCVLCVPLSVRQIC